MKVQFIGVGEALEPSLGNTSILVSGSKTILIDAGYAVPRNFLETHYACDIVDGIYFTHFHADHTFGLPALVYRWHEEGRTKPLFLIGQTGMETYVRQLIEFAYPQTIHKLGYPLVFQEGENSFLFGDIELSFAKTGHNINNYAICLTEGQHAIGVSGDGELTDASKKLFHNCTLLVHESFFLDKMRPGHTNAAAVVQFAKTLPRLKHLALVHIYHTDRENVKKWIREQKVSFHLFVPEPLETIELPEDELPEEKWD